jgi:hypothetical protein
MRFLKRVKTHLSIISANAWHYQLTAALWNPKRINQSKACSYYWFKLPLSLMLLPVAGIAILVLVLLVAAIAIVGWFFGFIPTFVGDQEEAKQYDDQGHWPYKTWPSGKRRRVLPSEIVGAMVGVYGVYYISFVHREIGLVVGIVLVGLIVLGGFLYLISSGWDSAPIQHQRSQVKAAWDKVCPPLTVVGLGHDDSSE